MRCDLCDKHTDKNYFTDNFTVLCEACAKNSPFYAGEQAIKYINKQTQRTTKK